MVVIISDRHPTLGNVFKKPGDFIRDQTGISYIFVIFYFTVLGGMCRGVGGEEKRKGRGRGGQGKGERRRRLGDII